MRIESKRRAGLIALAIGAVVTIFLLGRPGGAPTRAVRAAVAPRPATLPGLGGDGDAAGPASLALERIETQADEPAGPLQLEGQVVHDDESPAGGVEVVIDSRPPRIAVTEEDGSFAFPDLLPRRYSLLARGATDAAGPVAVDVDDDTAPVTLRLQGAGTVEVAVIEAGTGAPVNGATVELRGIDASSRTSDVAGVASFAAVVAGNYLVAIDAPGRSPVRATRFLHGHPGTVERVVIPLASGVAVSGTVTDSAGRPVAGARVVAVDAGAAGATVDLARDGAASGKDGAWSLPALAAGTYRLAVAHGSHPIEIGQPLTVGEHPVVGIDLRLPDGCRLRGAVRGRGGEPIAGARVAASARGTGAVDAPARSAVTDEQGRFQLDGLPAGEVDVVAQAAGAAAPPARASLEPGAPAEVTFVLDQDETIAGTLRATGTGQPVAEAMVVARPAEVVPGQRLRGDLSTVTDGDGGFVVRGLAPGKSYLLYAAGPGQAIAGAAYRQRALATVRAGSRDVGLELAVPRAIRGRAVLPGGSAPSLFTVALGSSAPVPFGAGSGEFSLRGIAPGEHRLRIDGPEFQRRVLLVDVPADGDVDLGTVDLSAGRRLTGVVTSASGAPVEGARVTFGARLVGDATSAARMEGRDDLGGRQATTSADGSFALAGVGDGPGVLVAEHPELGRSRPMRVPAGAAGPLTVALEPVGRVDGRVVEGERGVAGVSVFLDTVPDSGNTITAVTDSDGEFSLRSVSPGNYRAAAALPHDGAGAASVTRPVTVEPGATARVELPIPAGGVTLLIEPRIDGRAVREGQLVLGAQRMGGGSDAGAVIGEERPVRLDRVQPGSYRACVIPAAAADRVLGPDDLRGMGCQPLTIAAAPTQQSIVLDVPSPQR